MLIVAFACSLCKILWQWHSLILVLYLIKSYEECFVHLHMSTSCFVHLHIKSICFLVVLCVPCQSSLIDGYEVLNSLDWLLWLDLFAVSCRICLIVIRFWGSMISCVPLACCNCPCCWLLLHILCVVFPYTLTDLFVHIPVMFEMGSTIHLLECSRVVDIIRHVISANVDCCTCNLY